MLIFWCRKTGTELRCLVPYLLPLLHREIQRAKASKQESKNKKRMLKAGWHTPRGDPYLARESVPEQIAIQDHNNNGDNPATDF